MEPQAPKQTATSHEGYHTWQAGEGSSFEVFWSDNFTGGWYWWPCFPGCLPDTDGEPSGPFATSKEAYDYAMEG